MKLWFILFTLLGFSVLNAGCGKNRGRTSGQAAGIQSPAAEGRVTEIENQLRQRSVPVIPGYRILAALPREGLPGSLRDLDDGTVIGNVEFDFEIRKFALSYAGEVGAPAVSTEKVVTGFRAHVFRHPGDRTKMLIATLAAQPDEAFFQSRETVSIQHQIAMKCSAVYVPRRDRDSIPDQTSACDHKTELCLVKHVRSFAGKAFESNEQKLIWHIEHDYPGSRCVERKPDFTQVSQRENTRQAKLLRVQLQRSLQTAEATAIQTRL